MDDDLVNQETKEAPMRISSMFLMNEKSKKFKYICIFILSSLFFSTQNKF